MEWMIIVSIALNLFLAGATVATLFWKRECDRLLDKLEKAKETHDDVD